ncbi:MAG TPA: bifunctional oligoribonuclease/PAP phosphatase NrnA [Blastocatellia bacterium]|nr:bifunctional oligoribonuclease/PAP phosphatase NrnA [Blastocatellia bacterium]
MKMKTDERIKLREVPAGVDANTAAREKGKAEELEALLEAHRGERHIIVLQSFPDPDAISSAFAHQMIAARHDIECDIAYDGRVSHHENIALIELLRLQLLRVGESDGLNGYQGSVFIDTQGTTSGLTERLRDAGVPALAVIDHHEPQGMVEARFTDIRPGANATATIYTEYIESGLLRLEHYDPDHKRLATALMHGIRSETGGLVRAERDDFMAAAYLAEFVDRETLAAILSNRRSHNAMDVIQAALASRAVRDNYSVAGVGYLRYEDRDAIPQAADFLLTEENVHTAIVYGLVIEGGREMIIGSLRTKKATLNPDAFLKEALGGPQVGRYYGGGRREAGGFEIAIGFLAGSYDDEFMRWKWRLYEEQVKRRLWERMGVEKMRQPRGESPQER